MLLQNLVGFIIASIVLYKAADYAVKSIAKLGRTFRLSEFVIAFLVVGVASTFPEAFVTILSAIDKQPSIGLGAILGSNIADITLILGIVAIFAGKLKLSGKTVSFNISYVFMAMLPILLGLDRIITRSDGFVLIAAYGFFVLNIMREKKIFHKIFRMENGRDFLYNAFIFILSILILFISANYIVKFAEALAIDLSVPPILIGVILVALGTTLPELSFALKAVAKKHHELALGDLIGNVVMDATLVIGIAAVISPITFNYATMLLSGLFLFFGLLLAMYFIKTERAITKQEGVALVVYYILFVIIQLIAQRVL